MWRRASTSITALERQARAMGRKGLDVDSQTLWDQLGALARHLTPTYEALCAKVLASDVVFMDETHWRLMDTDGSHRWWTWCVASDDAAAATGFGIIVRRMPPQRSWNVHGVLMSDGYAVYEALARGARGFGRSIAGRMCEESSSRRRARFPRSAGRRSRGSAISTPWRHQVPQLPRTAPDEAVARRWRCRESAAGRALASDHRRAAGVGLRNKPVTLPQSSLGKAIDYMLSLWPGADRCFSLILGSRLITTEPNGAARRGGRAEDHYGSRSSAALRPRRLFYTLFESAKLAGVDPHHYVLRPPDARSPAPDAVTLPENVT